MEYGIHSVSAGDYQVRTGQKKLLDAFAEHLPAARDLVDTPHGLEMMGHTMEEILAGTWAPRVEELSKPQQTALALTLCNVLRLMVDELGEKMPPEQTEQSRTIALLMGAMDPEIAWMGIRNATGPESVNRPSQGGRFYNWTGDWVHHIISIKEWMDVIHKVRAYMRGRDA